VLGGVFFFLAAHAQAHTGHGLAPRLGNGRLAVFAVGQPGAVAQLCAGPLDGVIDSGVDLILDGAVACPTCRHDVSPMPVSGHQHRPGPTRPADVGLNAHGAG